MTAKIKVITISGTSFCGSTMLSAILGMHPEIVSGGEALSLVRHSIERPNAKTCACGEAIDDCAFWSPVKKSWLARTKQKDLRRFYNLIHSHEHIRHMYSIANPANRAGQDYEEYQFFLEVLYSALQESSGRPVVVDSTKRPGHQLLAGLNPAFDLRSIHLIRQGESVISSHLKHKGKHKSFSAFGRFYQVIRVGFFWSVVNRMSEQAAAWSGSDLLRIRYEDFVTDPADHLRRIGHHADLNFDALADSIASGQIITFGHELGNPISRKGPSPLRRNTASETRLPGYAPFVFSLLAGRTAKRYGY
jgi:hypothetical protein